MDFTAISLCMDNNLPIIVFNLFKRGSLKKIVIRRTGRNTIFPEQEERHDRRYHLRC